MAGPPRILIAEDESGIADTLCYALTSDGFAPVWCRTAEETLAQFSAAPPALAILDVGLPDLNGFELFKRLQALPGGSDVPMLFLTARSGEIDRVVGLELGADDYVTKPFNPKELMARVHAVLRRVGHQAIEMRRLGAGDLTIDIDRREVRIAGEEVRLTPTEFDLLVALAEHPGRVLSREQLLDRVLGGSLDGSDRAIDSHVKNLRQKIEPDPRSPRYVLTAFGVGYKFAGG
jgi:two-component system catabolic regulation response regulator CreB